MPKSLIMRPSSDLIRGPDDPEKMKDFISVIARSSRAMTEGKSALIIVVVCLLTHCYTE
jgi:hypothetical protein